MKHVSKPFSFLAVLAWFLAGTLVHADLALKPATKTFSANGSAGSVAYTLTNTSSSPISGTIAVGTTQEWITVLSGGGDYNLLSGKKLVGQVKFSVATNKSALQREGAISIGGLTFAVTQKGAACKIAVAPAAATVDKDGGEEQPIQITATLDCGWSVTSGSPWIEVSTSGTGTGEPQTVVYSVGKNDVLKPRTGKIYVQTTAAKPQKKTLTVKQPAQTMGTLPGTYAGVVNRDTLAQLVVTDKGKVSGLFKNIFGEVYSIAGTLSPLGALSATATLKSGTSTHNKAGPFDGSTDSAGNLVLTIHTTDGAGNPLLVTAPLSKKRLSSVPARYTLTEKLGNAAPAGVIDVAADATVSGLLVNAWSETLSVTGLVLESGEIVAIGTLANKVTAKNPESSYIFVMGGSYSEGPVLGLGLVSEDSDGVFVVYFQKTANKYVGVYGGNFAGTYPGGTFKGSFKIGVNADGSVRGYAISPGDEESAMLTGTANLTTGEFELGIYKYDTQADWFSGTPEGPFTGSVAADGTAAGSVSVPAERAQGTFKGSRLSAVPQLPTYAIGNRYLQYRNYPTTTSNYFAGWVSLTKNGEPISQTDVAAVRLLDPTGAEVAPDTAKSGYLQQEYMLYACTVQPCVVLGPIAEYGFYAGYPNLAEGLYTYEVTPADDSPKVTAAVAFPGEIALPFVSNGMSASWSGGDLHLQWTNPTSNPAWSEVTRVQVTVYDSSNALVLTITNAPGATQITVPAELAAQAKALGDGTLAWWRIETRANDDGGMNYARGYSASRGIPVSP